MSVTGELGWNFKYISHKKNAMARFTFVVDTISCHRYIKKASKVVIMLVESEHGNSKYTRHFGNNVMSPHQVVLTTIYFGTKKIFVQVSHNHQQYNILN